VIFSIGRASAIIFSPIEISDNRISQRIFLRKKSRFLRDTSDAGRRAFFLGTRRPTPSGICEGVPSIREAARARPGLMARARAAAGLGPRGDFHTQEGINQAALKLLVTVTHTGVQRAQRKKAPTTLRGPV
jgi:hypothetical protein